MNVRIERVYLETETLGSLYVDDVCVAKTLELPWKDNARSISCIPEGIYTVVKEAFTEKHPYNHFRVLNVPGRSGILFHRITRVKDLKGCLGIGGAFDDIDKDGVLDMVKSTVTLQKIYELLPDRFYLEIKKKSSQ